MLVAQPFIPPPNAAWRLKGAASLPAAASIDEPERFPAVLVGLLGLVLLLLVGGAVWLTRDKQTTAEETLELVDLEREREQERVAMQRRQRHVDLVREAESTLHKKDFVRAAMLFEQAALLERTSETDTGLKQAQAGIAARKAENLRKQQLVSEQRRQEQARLQIEQEKARVLQAKQRMAEAARQKEADFRSNLKAGQEALAKKQFDVAVKAFTAAERIRPGDPVVLSGLKRAQDAHQVAQKIERERENLRQEQARKTAFQNLLSSGRAALTRSDFQKAHNDFTAAAKLFPSDEARSGLRRADRGLEEQRQRERAAARRRAEAEALRQKELAAKKLAEQKRLEAKMKEEQKRIEIIVKKHLDAGRLALKDKKLAQASAAFSAARKLTPQSPAVIQAWRDLDTARRQANQTALDKLPLEKKQK